MEADIAPTKIREYSNSNVKRLKVGKGLGKTTVGIHRAASLQRKNVAMIAGC